jgi:acyl carrier protein
MKEKLIDKYDKVFIKCFKIKRAELKKLKYQSVPQWDSVGHMSMVGALEDSFKITFEMDDIIDFSSYEVGKKILKKYKVIIK